MRDSRHQRGLCRSAGRSALHRLCMCAGLRKGGQWQEALRIMSMMQDETLQPDVITCLGPVQTHQQISHCRHLRRYSAAVSACEKKGQWQAALLLLFATRLQRWSLLQGLDYVEYCRVYIGVPLFVFSGWRSQSALPSGLALNMQECRSSA